MTAGPGGLGYASFRMSPRAPRVAIVIPGGAGWRYWARLALHGASRTWGGAGFVLVPHQQGTVHPRLLHAAGAYDPDYVLLMDPTLGDYEALFPGELALEEHEANVPLDAERRRDLVDRAPDSPVPVAGGEEARQAVVDACSPYRRWDGPTGRWEEDQLWWSGEAPGYPFVSTGALRVDESRAVSVLPAAPGDAGLALTARIGTFLRPTPILGPVGAASASAAELDQGRAAAWLISGTGQRPGGMLSGPASGVAAFEAGSVGLATVGGAAARLRPALVMLGDSAEDFALALMWDRMTGRGIWLPRAWWPTAGGRTAELAGAALSLMITRVARRPPGVRLSTVSATEDETAHVLSRLQGRLEQIAAGRSTSRSSREPVALDGGAPWLGPGSQHLAVQGQYDQSFALPVRVHDDSGGSEMAAPTPAPAVHTTELVPHLPVLRWEVDLQAHRSPMPTGRGLDGHTLFAEGEDTWLTWVRSGRDGTSFNAHRYDFVSAGSTPEAALARPRLRDFGLADWANALVAPSGRTFRPSDAGLRVEILTRMAGGRAELADLLAGPLRPALRAFNTEAKSTRLAYPNWEGVALIDGGYLTLDGMASLSGMGPGDVRPVADTLLTAGILRRGLIVDCSSCQRPSFVEIGRLAQRNDCPRCDHRNELVHERWRRSGAEPAWYYDLHPAARELFRQHGDVPLLLSTYLRESSRRYTDIAELEMVDMAGQGLAESDLLAHADGRVITAEAKSNDALADSPKRIRTAAKKRVLLARALRADDIVLATTQPTWSAASVEALRSAIARETWPGGAPPVLRTICGLGGAVQDTSVSLKLPH